MRWTTTSSHACFRARSNCPRRILKHEERRFREVRLWCSTALDRTRRPAPVWRSHSNGKESRTCDHSPADCKAGWNAVTPSNRPRVMWSDVYQHSLRGELMRTLGVLLLFTTVCAAQVTDAQRQLFAYDFKQPLDVKQKQLEQRPWAQVFAIDYASPHGGRVTGSRRTNSYGQASGHRLRALGSRKRHRIRARSDHVRSRWKSSHTALPQTRGDSA